ncbi:DNA starvation/stationary phase protection protein [Vibrio coralliirubri]|uniref:Dps family protein n=1 Tax=Vibrio coralliirubri TaxID=1516159 RepID=UPI0022837FF8|nr:Dps family protein [Vibrio coralliirubri]MCY9865004.1 DNA starvation/stationary phase protection protein [Vibrio coralliirubri]
MAENIGLEISKSQELAKMLNELLGDYQIAYLNCRGYHWNVKGNQFFELHAKFEEIYTTIQTQIDEIAERVLTLGYAPVHSYSQYLKSPLKEDLHVTDGRQCVEGILNGFTMVIIPRQREIMKFASDAADEGTASLMSDYIRDQEKLAWMLSAYLGK